MRHFASPLLFLLIATIPALIAPNSPAADPPGLLQDESANKATIDDMSARRRQLFPLLGHGEAFKDEAERAKVAPTVLPLLQRIVGDYDAMHAHVIRMAGGVEFKFQPLGMLAYFGDDKIRQPIIAATKDKDPAIAVEASAALVLCDWWKGAKDSAAQQKVLDSFKALAHDHPNDDQLALAAMMMANTTPASPQMGDAVMNVVADELKSPLAQRLSAGVMNERKMKALEGKPLAIAGKSLDGKDFTTANWKGKVILVDFWASWCGPCKAELPRVKKAYHDYHAKGLEVLGVSCDRGAGPLHEYLDQNPEMAWPQLFDVDHPGWHPIATDLGIQSIPTMFLIDKAGIVRSITARKNFEDLIPAMLEEK